ncbi:hypothetical protein SAMN05428983_4645 [Agrobacterium fabrum]|uniref:Uncharacterized protein n=1 Tax=Agrobacterium fabrum TaxID=1176649 RepID=A0A7Z7BRW0_9HYPH|nr:hypothetical protein [Agrobacterium fabrum]SDK33863.1 hypothetical protein SAMN05428983_4645 [Agrobacterium fabrum]
MKQTPLEEEFAEAEEQLIEAMRIVNEVIRRAHKAGLDIKADIVTAYNEARPMPQITFWTPGWQRRVFPPANNIGPDISQ